MPSVNAIGVGFTLNKKRNLLELISSLIAGKMSVLWLGEVDGNYLINSEGDNDILITGKDFTESYIPATSSATFSLPDVASLKSDDEDNLWYSAGGDIQQLTVNDLISEDYERTVVKYSNFSPYNIYWIGLIKSGETFTNAELNLLHYYFELWILWSGFLVSKGKLKGNRLLSSPPLYQSDFSSDVDGFTCQFGDGDGTFGILSNALEIDFTSRPTAGTARPLLRRNGTFSDQDDVTITIKGNGAILVGIYTDSGFTPIADHDLDSGDWSDTITPNADGSFRLYMKGDVMDDPSYINEITIIKV